MKNEMRKKMLKLRTSFDKEKRAEMSKAIREKLFSLDIWKKSNIIFCYIDMGAEVNTIEIIKKAWSEGKTVCVPIAKKDRFMYFVKIDSFDGMERSSLGVMEPDISPEFEIKPDKNDLVLVPGSMFDKNKNRCGYGGGYYDTYGEKYSLENTVGLCYDFQLLDEIPAEKFDRKLNMIITDKQIIE